MAYYIGVSLSKGNARIAKSRGGTLNGLNRVMARPNFFF
jgi:hypothetical protein